MDIGISSTEKRRSMNIYCIGNSFTYFYSKTVRQTSDDDLQQSRDGYLQQRNDRNLQQRNDRNLQQRSDSDQQQTSDGDLQLKNNSDLQQSSGSFAREKAPDPQCRIINLQLLSRHIDDVTQHVATCLACRMVAQSLEPITVVGGKDYNGLTSIMGCKFKGCGQELIFNTSTKATGLTGKFFWTNKLAAVWGQMSVEGGFNSLEESLNIFNIPVMTQRYFVHTEQMIGKWWWKLLEKSMISAGKEEKQIAINKG